MRRYVGRIGQRRFPIKPAQKQPPEGKLVGWKRNELYAAGDGNLFAFINDGLLPHLHGLDVDLKTKLPNPNVSRK
jgi:type I restriction enzyme M protein